MLIFCQVRVRRAFRKRLPDHPATYTLDLIWEAKTKQDVIDLLDQMASTWPETSNWVKNKKKDWILAALSSQHSKIPIDWWNNATHHTGISESSHFMDNEAVGRKQALLTGILK